MGADERAFSGLSSSCPMRWVPESGGSPPGTLHGQATAYCRSGICDQGQRDMHAEEETKHCQEQGQSSTKCLWSSIRSSTRSSGAPIGQQASFKQSVPALRMSSLFGKGADAYKIKVEPRFVPYQLTTKMASSF